MYKKNPTAINKSILITGIAGFIGYHLAKIALNSGYDIIGVDNFDEYYDVDLKKNRLKDLFEHQHLTQASLRFYDFDIQDSVKLELLVRNHHFDYCVHLAAQAGVRYSLENPHKYIKTNINGFFEVLHAATEAKVEHFLYASTSSVYGLNNNLPQSENHNVDHPIQLYAATKRSNELIAHSYSAIHGIPCSGLRFFTVYGPWGRPDMALFKFTEAILNDRPIELFNNGNHSRDFTYVEDVANSIIKLLPLPPSIDENFNCKEPETSTSKFQHRIVNVGKGSQDRLLDYVALLEQELGKTAKKIYLPLQKGDVGETHCDNENLEKLTSFRPSTNIADGVKRFVEWYMGYYVSE